MWISEHESKHIKIDRLHNILVHESNYKSRDESRYRSKHSIFVYYYMVDNILDSNTGIIMTESEKNELQRLNNEVNRLNEVCANLQESQTIILETIIDHIASLDADRDTLLRSYDDAIQRIIDKHSGE
ncbi:hypothetical protein VPHK571_0311 [Vibrio phage K571]